MYQVVTYWVDSPETGEAWRECQLVADIPEQFLNFLRDLTDTGDGDLPLGQWQDKIVYAVEFIDS